MIKKFNKLDNNKKIPIVITVSVILLTIIIVYTFFRNSESGYKSIKVDTNKELVYTLKETRDDVFYIKVPYININGSTIKSINEDIDSYLSEFIDTKMKISTYEYNINGKVLSLAIKTVDYYNEDMPIVYFKTYNINLDTLELVSDEELLNAYDINFNDVNNAMEKQFKYWYKELKKEKYLTEEECDYECFLEYRGVEDYMDNISYYIDEGKLVVFKPFSFYSVYKEEDYFKEDDFKFIISN